MLSDERSDLNASWFNAPAADRPDENYFTFNLGPEDRAFTTDGWPGEGYMELVNARRLLVGFGNVDIAENQYNASADEPIIFRSGALERDTNVAFPSGGTTVTAGCIFDSNSQSIAAANNSWAVQPLSSQGGFIGATLASVSSLDTCGISPFLNSTLSNVTADVNMTSYMQFAADAIWSWQAGQPDSTSNANNTRCAALNLTSAATGKWQVAQCASRYPGACRVGGSPYTWTLTTQRGSYDAVDRVCPSNSSFDVPRTALENTYLRSAIASIRGYSQPLSATPMPQITDPDDQLIWLNLNDLDVQGCWVTGIDTRCPYTGSTADSSRQVIVPIIAAVIVFCLAGFTVLVKCAANRSGSKRRRRRGDALGEYEGVPS